MSWVDQMRLAEAKISPRQLNGMFYYDAGRGWLVWRAGRRRGHAAGYAHPNGYVMVKIKRRLYRAHRIIWAIVMDQWPVEFIDHKNGNGLDNRWSNLRAATHAQNELNKPGKLGASGFRRVAWDALSGKWAARVKHRGKLYHLGLFLDPKEAYQIASAKAAELHGAFARYD